MKKFTKALLVSLFFFGVFLGPVSTAFAQGTNTQNAINNPVGQSPDYTDRLQNCVFNHLDGSGTFAGCLVNAFYYLVLYPSGKFAQLTGQLMDFFIAYSLDSNSYTQANGEFVDRGWGLIRDIANVLFIFLLLFIAIKHILKGSDAGTKKMLISIIIAALLINFSLFFSKVVIDAGNILGRAFYNNIEIQYDDQNSGTGVRTISQGLAEKVQPQKLLGSELFRPVSAPGQPPGTLSNGYAFFIMAVAAFVNITMGIVFLSSFLLFAARVIGLWFMMIFSPIAFASLAMGGGGSFFGQFGFESWKNNILKLSFMAPVFMFFLYLLIMFLQIVMGAPAVAGNEDTVHSIMKVMIPFIAIIVVLRQAKKIAADMAGEFGTALTGAVSKIAGMAAFAVGGAAIGVAAAGGRAIIGRGAAAVAESDKAKKLAAKNALFRNIVYKPSDKVSKASMDLRNTALGKRSGQLLNDTLKEAGFGAWSAGKGTSKGGYVQRVEAYQKEKEAFKEQIKTSDHTTRDVTYSYYDSATQQTVTRQVSKSLIDAETEFLRVQNESKREDRTYNIRNSTMGGPRQDLVKDYDGWVKEKEGAEKAQKQAETDYANVARNPQSSTQQIKDALTKKDYFTNRHKDIKDIVKSIEGEWASEERDFKAIQKDKNKEDVKRQREYADSVAPSTLNGIYDLATGRTGGKDARGGASASIRLGAEKEDKKAIAAEKKEDKK